MFKLKCVVATVSFLLTFVGWLHAEETREVKLSAITLVVPITWKQSKPDSRFRLAQFDIPDSEHDMESAELMVYNHGTTDVKANITRWVAQFYAEGRTVKTTTGTTEMGEYFFAEISGTYRKPVGPASARSIETIANTRVLGVIVPLENGGSILMKLTGPDKTVVAAALPFRSSFGAKAEKEKPLTAESLD